MLGLGHALTLALSPMGGGTAFDPMNIEALSEWFDYRTLAGVGDGNPIDAWAGRKNLITLSQSGTARPTYVLGDLTDGRPTVAFNGVNQGFNENIQNVTLYGSSGDHEIWFRFKVLNSQAVAAGLLSTNGSTNTIFIIVNDHVVNYSVSNSQAYTDPVALWDGAWHTVRAVRAAGVRKLFVDGVSYHDTTDMGTYATGVDHIGIGNAFYAYYLNGGIRHALFFTATLDDATAAKLYTYLQTA